jgi:hypothetical protein
MVPLVGMIGARVLPASLTGGTLPPYLPTGMAVGEGTYSANDNTMVRSGQWENIVVAANALRSKEDVIYATTNQVGATIAFTFNGQEIVVQYSVGPDHGIWEVEVDGNPLLDTETGKAVLVDGYNNTLRYNESLQLDVVNPGVHTLILRNTGDRHPSSNGMLMAVRQFEVLSPKREGNLGVIMGMIVVLELVGLLFAWAVGPRLFVRVADQIDTRKGIVLALIIYAVVAIWGYFLNSVIEFWFLALMVAIVQGGSQALSRSLYASLSPAAKSGEFFGLFGVMEKFSAIAGPLLFAVAAQIFNSSRPAILSLIVFFFAGMAILLRVDIAAGVRVAREEDKAAGLDRAAV